MLTLNSHSSCLYLPNARITGVSHHTRRCFCVGFYCGGSLNACALHPIPCANIHSPVVQATGHHQEHGRPWHVALSLGGSEAATEVNEEDEKEGDVPATDREQLTGLAIP